MNPACNRPKERAKTVKQIEEIDKKKNRVSEQNSLPSHVFDNLSRVLFAFVSVIIHVLAGKIAITDLAVQKRPCTLFIVHVRVLGGGNFLSATKRTTHILCLSQTLLRVLKHPIVPGDVTTFALDLLLLEKNLHVAPNRSRDERLDPTARTLHFASCQVLGTLDAENLVTSCNDASLRIEHKP